MIREPDFLKDVPGAGRGEKQAMTTPPAAWPVPVDWGMVVARKVP